MSLFGKKRKVKQPLSDTIFDTSNVVIMTILVIVTVFPLLYLIAAAFSDGTSMPSVLFLPMIDRGNGPEIGITLDNFKYIIFEYDNGIFLNSIKNTAIITVCVTLGSNILMALAAYPLSKPNCPCRTGLLVFFMIVMLFSAGIIPSYLLMTEVKLTGNILGIILISLTNVFNLLLFKTTFEGIPKELEESAQLDGATSLQMFFKIIIPITLPTFASCCFFTLVGCINGYSSAILFIRNNAEAKPMAQILYELVTTAASSKGGNEQLEFLMDNLFNIQSAGIILSTIPILIIYPFIIRYIKSGVTLGSVKG